MFREKDLIILIGAGCSADADVPTSKTMIKSLHDSLENKRDWRRFKNLYYYIKSSIHYVDGIKGKFDDYLDIERLVNVLGELEKKDDCILFL